MMIRGIVTAVTFCLGAMLLPSPAAAEPAYGRWSSEVVQVYSTADARWKVGRAIAAWNRGGVVQLALTSQPCLECIVIQESSTPLPGVQPEDAGGWDGLAYPRSIDGQVISNCTVLLDPNALDYTNIVAITTHEIGHCLGLPHSPARWSIMSREPGRPLEMVYPRNHDWKKLGLLYG